MHGETLKFVNLTCFTQNMHEQEKIYLFLKCHLVHAVTQDATCIPLRNTQNLPRCPLLSNVVGFTAQASIVFHLRS